MPNYICTTCGVQYAESSRPPDHCPICEDERQYVNPNGQQWTTLAELQADHHTSIRSVEPGLHGLVTEPTFAIGQRPLLIQGEQGNVLWDCNSFVDEETFETVSALGGITSIAISHPHFYDSMVEWSRAFGDVPIHLHAADRQWVMRPDANIAFWEGKTLQLNDEVTLIHCGGHYAGSSVLHWAQGAEGRGVLMTGDTIYVVTDKRYVTFMYSYPNSIPLGAGAVQNIADAVEPFEFDRLYSGWWHTVIESDAKAAVKRSAARYIAKIQS